MRIGVAAVLSSLVMSAAVAQVHSRHIALEGAANFRDLGGYSTVEGRTTRWGLLYRSDALSHLTAADQRRLSTLRIVRITDFRSRDEIERAPDKLPPALEDRWVNLPIGDPRGADREFQRKFYAVVAREDAAEIGAMMQKQYVYTLERSEPAIKEWLRGLAGPDAAGAQVFHCNGGRDRTGVAAAILLLILGVPEDEVMQDYTASNAYLSHDAVAREAFKAQVLKMTGVRVHDSIMQKLEVREQYLQAALTEKSARYGSLENYFREALGLDDAMRVSLRTRFLQ